MKRPIFALISVFLLSLSNTSLWSLPVSNPASPSLLCDGLFCTPDPYPYCRINQFSLRLGSYNDYVYNRNLQVNSENRDRHVDESILTTNAAEIVVNYNDRLEVFTTVGASTFELNTNLKVFDTAVVSQPLLFTLYTDTHFSWSVGGRAALYKWCNFIVGIEGQYFSANLPIFKTVRVEQDARYFDGSVSVDYREWQVGLGASYTIGWFVPYIAIKGGRAWVNMDNFTFQSSGPSRIVLFDLESAKHVGYAVGVTFVGNQKIDLTLEWRYGDERALFILGEFRF